MARPPAAADLDLFRNAFTSWELSISHRRGTRAVRSHGHLLSLDTARPGPGRTAAGTSRRATSPRDGPVGVRGRIIMLVY